VTNARMISAQYPKSAGAIVPTIKGKPSQPKEVRKVA